MTDSTAGGGSVRLELDPYLAQLLTRLPDMLRSLLPGRDSGDDGRAADLDSDDPQRVAVIERLFPACVDGDEDADREVRDLLFEDLLEQRLDGLDALERIVARGQRHRGRVRVELRDDEPALVLGVINDLRLTLAYQVGIEEIDRDELDADHPAAPTLAVVDHLAGVQEQLLAVIDPTSAPPPPPSTADR